VQRLATGAIAARLPPPTHAPRRPPPRRRRRAKLEAARAVLEAATTVQECVGVTDATLQIASAVANKVKGPPAPGAGEPAEPACTASAADVETADDGNVVSMLRLPRGWSGLRTKAFAERFRLAVAGVEKKEGWTFAVLRLASMDGVDEAAAALAAQVVDGTGSVLLKRGIVLPQQASA